ncbi:MAG: cytochrome P450, partial [Leptolyngbyaceae cyanobacterium RU_5_1]|nr:cytochrome P450 [Leptolyngbyaceae cyanobacterium RU_5_1]
PRIVKSPVQVMGYDFEPEMMLVPCIYLVHQRADLYPEPQQFKPERFLERQFSPYEFLPFGGSNRRCIGAAFALYEMKLALATILMQCELAIAETKPVRPMRRGVTTAPKGGVRMVMTGRRAVAESAGPLAASV